MLAICHHRFDEKISRLDWIGALMWLDGEPVSVSFVREALRREFLRGHLRPLPRNTTRGADQADRVARRLAKATAFRQVTPGLSPQERVDVSAALLSTLLGTGEPSADAIASVDEATGINSVNAEWPGALRAQAKDVAVVVSSSDEVYSRARQLWITNQLPVTPCRSAKSRVCMKKVLADFYGHVALVSIQEAFANANHG